jgi:hypothetical protein
VAIGRYRAQDAKRVVASQEATKAKYRADWTWTVFLPVAAYMPRRIDGGEQARPLNSVCRYSLRCRRRYDYAIT